jgi:hypothetical protein
MSLAIYAAPFNEDSNNDFSSNNSTGQKGGLRRNINNRTQKRVPTQDYNSMKVNTVLNAIHSKPLQPDDNLGDFKPLAPPTSIGVENTKRQEEKNHHEHQHNEINSHNDDDDIDLHALKNNYMTEQVADQYYKQFIPNYKMGQQGSNKMDGFHSHHQYQPQQPMNVSNETLMTKLNYMIHLLEEQQDEKTNNVTEEVILYSFLGIFMIFIVDSFVKVGKYVR